MSVAAVSVLPLGLTAAVEGPLQVWMDVGGMWHQVKAVHTVAGACEFCCAAPLCRQAAGMLAGTASSPGSLFDGGYIPL